MHYPARPGSRERHTLCISSQAGCAVGCPFCATGELGFGRNLETAEILDQVRHAARRLQAKGRRLAHPHEDDVGDIDRRIEQPHLPHLAGDLVDLEVSLEAHRPGRAECARERASGLRRDAERHPPIVGNRDRLDPLAIGKGEEKFRRPIDRFLPDGELEARDRERLRERLPHPGRQLRHRCKLSDRRLPEAPRDLACPVLRLAAAGEERGEARFGLGRRQVEQVLAFAGRTGH